MARRLKNTGQAKRLKLPSYRARRRFLFALMGLIGVALIGQALMRQVFEIEFLQDQGARRYLREVEVPADRGLIVDRNGERLAASTPVDTVWADPRELNQDKATLQRLAKALEMKPEELRALLDRYRGKSFAYLRRRVTPDVAEAVKALQLDGVNLDREYRRYYPAGEVVSHVLGFTDVDDKGQEGLELTFEQQLAGKVGKKRIIRDGRRRIVSDVESIEAAQPGARLQLSLDLRLQFLAYRELKAAVEEHQAVGGALVLMDARNGEILAMVNQPGYNPNGNRSRQGGRLRNRAITDLFEPGSTIKPFVAAAALASGKFRPNSPVDTRPGFLRVGSGMVRDVHNYGPQDLTGVIRKSSNVGVTKLSLALGAKGLWDIYDRIGIGSAINTGFPGEGNGRLTNPSSWREFDQAVLSFGYGISLTALQLARAYAVLANDGLLPEPSFLPRDEQAPVRRVLSPEVSRQVRLMLEEVVTTTGTAPKAAVPGYRVGGKTGTAKKAVAGGYADKRYLGLFVGMAPMSDPRLVMVVVIDEPRGKEYYGGLVAAPVFSKVMAGALRLLGVAPDAPDAQGVRLAMGKTP